MKGNEKVGEFNPDNLIYDSKLSYDTKTISIPSGQGEVKRGTLIAFTDPDAPGVIWTGAEGEVANCIICDDVDTGDTEGSTTVAHAYRTGHFTRQALILGEDELTKKAEKQLEDAGIYLSNAVL